MDKEMKVRGYTSLINDCVYQAKPLDKDDAAKEFLNGAAVRFGELLLELLKKEKAEEISAEEGDGET